MCVIRSMHADVPNHEPSLMLMNCGDGRLPRPSMGAWVTYGLGSENQNLPGFIAMCPGGYPIVGPQNWRSAFLPGAYQGTYIDTQHTRRAQADREHPQYRHDLCRAARSSSIWCGSSTSCTCETRPGDPALEARIQTFELAYRMQREAGDAFDINREPLTVRERYGTARTAGSCSSRAGCSSAACASCRSGAAPASRGTTTTTSKPASQAGRRRGTRPSPRS